MDLNSLSKEELIEKINELTEECDFLRISKEKLDELLHNTICDLEELGKQSVERHNFLHVEIEHLKKKFEEFTETKEELNRKINELENKEKKSTKGYNLVKAELDQLKVQNKHLKAENDLMRFQWMSTANDYN